MAVAAARSKPLRQPAEYLFEALMQSAAWKRPVFASSVLSEAAQRLPKHRMREEVTPRRAKWRQVD
jgi:hypothetical protein